MIILRSNLRNFGVKQNKPLIGLKYIIHFYIINKWKRNIRNGKIF